MLAKHTAAVGCLFNDSTGLLSACPPACLPGPPAVRKGYHLLAVSLFLPALLLERQLLGVALAGALAVLLALEVLRLSGLPGVGELSRNPGQLCRAGRQQGGAGF